MCLGTDPFHTPEALADRLEAAFRARGYSVARNVPYAGAIVPLPYYNTDRRVRAVMVEVNRGLYLAERGNEAE